MDEKSIFLKYDGESEDFENHLYDAKDLSVALSNLADLLYDANTLINGLDSQIEVKAKAGFREGSFGLELIIGQDILGAAKDILPVLGLVASAGAGSLLSVLMRLKGNEITEITYDERTEEAEIAFGNEKLKASKDVADLIQSQPVRRRLSRIIYEPLEREHTESFELLDSDSEAVFLKVTKDENHQSFKTPAAYTSISVDELDTVAKVEFIKASKDSGMSGWKMLYLGEEVSVKIKDEAFLETLRRPDAPSIFGQKFSVELHMKKKQTLSGQTKKTYTIVKVRSAVHG